MLSLPAQLGRTRRFTTGVPSRFTVLPGGEVVLFLRDRGLWALDTGSGRERLLAADVDSCAGLAFTRAGELWTVDLDGRERRLPAAVPASVPRPDPAGERIAYVSDGVLRMVATVGGLDRALGPADECWWAPDGERLLVMRADHAGVPRGAVRYIAAGERNPEIALAVVDLSGRSVRVRWDGEVEYLPRAGWDGHGPYAVVQSRDQRTLRLLAIDPATGATTVRHEQHDDRWVHVVPGLPARTPAGALVAHEDHDDTRHLTVDGTAVTPPGLQLREVLDVSEGVLFTASTDPRETHLWSFREGGLRRVSTSPGTVRDGSFVHLATPGRVTLVRDRQPPLSVASLAEKPVLDAYPIGLELGPRALRAALFLPSWHRAGVALPVLLDPYAGASRQRVTAVPDWRDLVSQWFAEAGFAVLVVDGAGTPGRGPSWERAIHGDIFGPVLDDQIAALHSAAERFPDLDFGRVGIRGWSFGGSLAALAVLSRPDVFHAAVAGAGVTDQRLYHAYARERLLGHPAEFPARYDAGSLLDAAPGLTRPLLLMHGLADDNVRPLHTLRLCEQLRAAGRPHEVMLLPGIGHSAIGSPVTEQILSRQLDFLRRHLRARGA